MLEKVEVLCHTCIKFSNDTIIYFDPFKIENEFHDADFIFITHSHYDHFSEEDILKVKNERTKICIPIDLYEKTMELGFEKENILQVLPNESYELEGMHFETIPAYNLTKSFHPKENQWVGYVLTLEGIRYYIAGDTDMTKEAKQVACDVAFVPIGGTYTMDKKEAAELIRNIQPNMVVPTHYGCIVGEKEDGRAFKKLIDKEIECRILIP